MRLPSSTGSPARPPVLWILSTLLRWLPLALIYFSSARIALLFAYEHTNASPFWAPSGMALAAFAIFGRRAAPGIALGAFSANAVAFVSNGSADPSRIILLSATIAAGNTSASYLAWRVLGRARVASGIVWDLRTGLRFLAASGLGALASAVVGTVVLLAGTSLSSSEAPVVFRVWLLGDAAGLLMVFPFVISWWCSDAGSARAVLVERVALFAATAACVAVIVFWPHLRWVAIPLLALPLLALRFASARLVWTLGFGIASLLIWKTIAGVGAFALPDQNESALCLQVVLVALSAAMVLGSTRWKARFIQTPDSGAGLLLGAAPDRPWSVSLPGLAVALLGAVVSVATWVSLLRAQDASVRRVIAANAASLAEHLEARFADSTSAVRRIAERWEDYGGLPESLWRRDIRRYLRDHPAIQALEWVDEDTVVRWVEPLAGNEAAVGMRLADERARREALERARQSGHPQMSPAVALRQGGVGFVLSVALRPSPGPGGFMVGVFKIDAIVAHLYARRSAWDPGFFTLQVWQGPRLLYSSAALEGAVPGPAEGARVTLVDQTLTLRLVPTAAFLAHESSTVATLVLNAGLLLSVLLGTSLALMSIALEQARRARRATATKARFLATMSHEIRTPMTGILGAVDLALERPLDAEARGHLMLVEQCGRSLQAIINDILDFSKIESGHLALERIVFNPGDLAHQAVELFRAQARERNLELSLILEPTLPKLVLGDPVRVRQVTMNLLSNALKFTHAGSVELAVRIAGTSEDGLQMRIVCRDTGIGMAPATVAQLFAPFMQGDASTTRRFGGTGLGLAIVKQLAMAMDGDVRCESQLGQGSTFFFDFTVGVAPDDAMLTSTGRMGAPTPIVPWSVVGGVEPSAPSRTPEPGAPARRVLLAEDSAVNQKLIAVMLERQGCQVDVVSDGAAAVARVAAKAYDLVFMDMQMPIMDGLEACRQIRAAAGSRRVPIVALTANAFDDDRRACEAAGMDDFLSKPVRSHHLREKLEKFAKVPLASEPTPAEAEARVVASPLKQSGAG